MREYSRGLVLENSEDFPEDVMRELILRCAGKESSALKEEGVQGSQRLEKNKLFSFPTFLVLVT